MTESSIKRRMLFHGPGQPYQEETTEAAIPLLEGEALIAVSLATICGSDLHTHAGRRPAPLPCVLGHEGTGTVVGLGSGRDETLLGRRVTWTLADSCGRCSACADWDLPQKCVSLFKYGHASLTDASGWNGCFASHLVLRRGTTIIPLPDDLPDSLAAPANCALATMVAVTDAVPASPCAVLILGAGLLGLYGGALLHERGYQVSIVEPDSARRHMASSFGAEDLHEDLQSMAEGTIDAVIEVAGVPHIVPESLRTLRPGGRLVLAGLVHPESALTLQGDQIIRQCATIQGVHNYAPSHLARALAWLHRHQQAFPFANLVSPPLPLSRLDDAFQQAASRRWHRVAVTAN